MSRHNSMILSVTAWVILRPSCNSIWLFERRRQATSRRNATEVGLAGLFEAERSAGASSLAGLRGIAWSGNSRVGSADLGYRLQRVLGESRLRIRTEEWECLTLRHLMPQVFQVNGSRLIAPRPEQSDHLTKCTHAPSSGTTAGDQLPYETGEPQIVRPLFYHESGEGFFRDQRDILI